MGGHPLIRLFSLAPPDHLKIDTDGGELEILRGFGVFLNDVKSIFVEINSKSYEEYLDLLKIHGFTHSIAGSGQTIGSDIYINHIFTR
jgi:hypothetical protein